MILLEIDLSSVFAVEFERDAPRPIHVDCIACGVETPKGMEIEARQVQVLGVLGKLQTIKSKKDTFMHPGIDLRGSSLFEQLRESFASERSDHRNVSHPLTLVNK
jgi:hypothetical protein